MLGAAKEGDHANPGDKETFWKRGHSLTATIAFANDNNDNF